MTAHPMPVDSDPTPHTCRPLWLMVLIFLASVILLQWGWSQARGSMLERLVIDQATVSTAVALINQHTPEVHAHAVGPRIAAPGGGIHVQNGCDGVEVLVLILAALMAYPLTWRMRLVGMLGGVGLVFSLNQLRLLALFYSYRADKALFDQLHGLVAPLLLMAAALGFVMLLIRGDEWLRATARPA
jgi:exosortase/archaeosortase family protein